MTNFFNQISALTKMFDINITITQQNGVMTVGLYPKAKSKEITENFPPLILNGLPEEFDTEFFDKITNAMKKTEGIISNIQFYAKQMDEKKKNAEAAATKKKEAKSTTKPVTSAVTLLSEEKPVETKKNEVKTVKEEPTIKIQEEETEEETKEDNLF